MQPKSNFTKAGASSNLAAKIGLTASRCPLSTCYYRLRSDKGWITRRGVVSALDLASISRLQDG